MTARTLVMIAITLAGPQATVTAQDAESAQAGGHGIEGTWNMFVQWRDCETGDPLPVSGPTMIAYAQGGVLTEMAEGIPPTARTIGLGAWRHATGRNYVATFKAFRYNPDGTFAGKLIVDTETRHELDDTVNSRAVARIYNEVGDVIAIVCPTASGTRFTGDD